MKYLDKNRVIKNKNRLINVRTEIGMTPDSALNEEVFYIHTRILGICQDDKWFNPAGIGKISISSLTDIEDMSDTIKMHERFICEYAEDVVTKVQITRKLVNTIYEAYLTEVESYL